MVSTLPDNLTNLEPQTTREWLQHINHKIDGLTEAQSEDHLLLCELNEKTDERLKALECDNTENREAIDTLKVQTRSWNAINSIGVVITGILMALGLKGS